MKELGISPSKCINTHPVKTYHNIHDNVEFGVEIFVYDNESELTKLLPYKKKVKLLLRLSFPNEECACCLSK